MALAENPEEIDPRRGPPVATSAPLRRTLPSIVVLVMLVLLSVGWFFVIRQWERKSFQNAFLNLATARVEILRNRMMGSLEVLRSIAQLYSAQHPVSRLEFERFVSDALKRHPEVQCLSWNPRVPGAQRESFEAQGRQEGFPDFEIRELDKGGHLVRAAQREEYVPVYFENPLEKNRPALGFDLASNPEREAALENARDTDKATATAPLRLVQETGNQMGFLVVLPIYRGPHETAAERGGNLIGYASAVFRTGDLVESAWRNLGWADVEVWIHSDDNRRKTLFYHSMHGQAANESGIEAEGSALAIHQTLEVAGSAWDIVFRPTPKFLASQVLWQSWAALAAGLIITLLLAACVFGWLRRAAEIERRVVERTAQLSREMAERKRIEEELRTAEKKYRSIFENSIEGVFQTTREGRYISANPALAAIYGYASPEELIADLDDIGRRLYIEPDRRKEFIRAVQDDSAVSCFESQVRRKDGSVIWISEKARAVRGEKGDVLYYEGAVENITERKRAEDALQAAHNALELRVQERTVELGRSNEALLAEIIERKKAEDAAASASKAKSTFLAHMSHEIRTPLNAVLGHAQILQRDKSLPREHRPAIEAIANSGAHLFGLIDDVLDISKIEAGRMELQQVSFDLTSLVKRLETMFRHRCDQKRLQFVVTAPNQGRPCWVHGDEGKLRQILINLLGNAVKFTERGEIRLTTGAESEGKYRFEVADSGIGIDPEEQASIITPFAQGSGGIRKGGSGLGLAISKRQIELMSGELRFDSEAGVGSRFFFSLPLPQVGSLPPCDVLAEYRHARLAPGEKVNALVVDDIEENRHVLAGLLSAAGCDVFTAESGQHALELARASEPDIIFMDIWMPGMNGIETTHALLAESRIKAKIVAHSASAFDHEQKRYLDAGFDDFFAKPFRYERICECLADHLHVRFEQEPPPAFAAIEPIPLPAELASRLKAAAELYNITEMKAHLCELALLGGPAEEVANRLMEAVQQHDLAFVLDYLAESERLVAV